MKDNVRIVFSMNCFKSKGKCVQTCYLDFTGHFCGIFIFSWFYHGRYGMAQTYITPVITFIHAGREYTRAAGRATGESEMCPDSSGIPSQFSERRT